MSFLTLLPAAVFLLGWWIAADRLPDVAPSASRRSAFVLTFVGFQLLVGLMAELASVGHQLTRTTLASFWLIALILLIVLERHRLLATIRGFRLRGSLRPLRDLHLTKEDLIGLALVGIILTILALTAALYPQSNADSWAYHLPRVEHWIQNRSVAHFATHSLIQLEYPLWLALDQVGWQGVIDSISIEDVPFPNPSRRLQRVGFEPCSTLRRVDLNAVTTDVSKINLRWNVLMASFEPALAPRLSASTPFVDNTVEGLRVLPGGGWSALIAGTSAAFAGNEATLFLYSQHPRHVTLRFDGAPGVVTVVAQPQDGEVGMPAEAQPGGSLDVRVPAGITELRLHLAGADTLPATESVPIHVAVSRAG